MNAVDKFDNDGSGIVRSFEAKIFFTGRVTCFENANVYQDTVNAINFKACLEQTRVRM